ncbi:hypothetical protein ACOMHN_006403 [Nucella lapillus]
MSTYGPVSAVNNASPSFQDVLESLADYKASVAAWRYCPPFILVLGTLGNLMILWVLGVKSGASSYSMPIYFRALAVSDLVLLYTGLLRNWVKYLAHLDVRDMHSAVCKIHIFLVYVTSMTSAWFLVMMTTQRAISVVWPHKLRQLHSRKTASISVAVIVVIICLFNAHQLYGYEVRYYPDYGQYYCDYLDPDYEHFARGPWPWVDMCLASLLPFAFLLTSNSLLMWKVTSSIRDVRKLTNTGHKSQEVASHRQKQSTSLNVTLIFLSAMFFLLTSPVCVFLILDHYFHFDLVSTGDPGHVAASTLGWGVTNLLLYTNSAINFYLYFLTGSRFRAQVWQCLLRVVLSRRSKTRCVGQTQRRSDLRMTSDASSHM